MSYCQKKVLNAGGPQLTNRLYFRSLFLRQSWENLECAFPTEIVTHVMVSFLRQMNPHCTGSRCHWPSQEPATQNIATVGTCADITLSPAGQVVGGTGAFPCCCVGSPYSWFAKPVKVGMLQFLDASAFLSGLFLEKLLRWYTEVLLPPESPLLCISETTM